MQGCTGFWIGLDLTFPVVPSSYHSWRNRRAKALFFLTLLMVCMMSEHWFEPFRKAVRSSTYLPLYTPEHTYPTPSLVITTRSIAYTRTRLHHIRYPSFLSTYQPTNLPTYLPTYLPLLQVDYPWWLTSISTSFSPTISSESRWSRLIQYKRRVGERERRISPSIVDKVR